MIGNNVYNSVAYPKDEVKYVVYDYAQPLTDFCNSVARDYSPLEVLHTTDHQNASDSYWYYRWGRQAIFMEEMLSNSNAYHTSCDVVDSMDFSYLAKTTSLAFAITYLATLTNDYYPIGLSSINSEKLDFSLLKNPSHNEISFRLQSANNIKASVVLIDQMGREVFKS